MRWAMASIIILSAFSLCSFCAEIHMWFSNATVEVARGAFSAVGTLKVKVDRTVFFAATVSSRDGGASIRVRDIVLPGDGWEVRAPLAVYFVGSKEVRFESPQGTFGPIIWSSEVATYEAKAGRVVARNLRITTCQATPPHYFLKVGDAEVLLKKGSRGEILCREVSLFVGQRNPLFVYWSPVLYLEWSDSSANASFYQEISISSGKMGKINFGLGVPVCACVLGSMQVRSVAWVSSKGDVDVGETSVGDFLSLGKGGLGLVEAGGYVAMELGLGKSPPDVKVDVGFPSGYLRSISLRPGDDEWLSANLSVGSLQADIHLKGDSLLADVSATDPLFKASAGLELLGEGGPLDGKVNLEVPFLGVGDISLECSQGGDFQVSFSKDVQLPMVANLAFSVISMKDGRNEPSVDITLRLGACDLFDATLDASLTLPPMPEDVGNIFRGSFALEVFQPIPAKISFSSLGSCNLDLLSLGFSSPDGTRVALKRDLSLGEDTFAVEVPLHCWSLSVDISRNLDTGDVSLGVFLKLEALPDIAVKLMAGI